MRREYVGGAQRARLTTALAGTTVPTTITCDNLANWPTGTGGTPFFVVVDRNTASEEKILCASRVGNVITIYDVGLVNGRAADDTSITSHSSNATIEHVFTATDADEANALVSLVASGSNGDVFISDDTQPYGAKWDDIQGTLSIISPFLLMGA